MAFGTFGLTQVFGTPTLEPHLLNNSVSSVSKSPIASLRAPILFSATSPPSGLPYASATGPMSAPILSSALPPQVHLPSSRLWLPPKRLLPH